ncbi:MAG: tyrosine-type recombinase/integrase [Clostridiales bacterium]|nr:tyrosine-type recombinase/integrase [Clostridiales bacterium]
MSEKRRDKKKRILRNGESQRQDGRYVYKYTDNNGKAHFVYSWKLEKTDKIPQGKRDCVPLRELEKKIQKDLMDGINLDNKKTTVLQLVEKYVRQKNGASLNTKNKYRTVLNRLKKDPFGQFLINKVKMSDAKDWCSKLQNGGCTIGTVGNYRKVLRPAFQMAVDDDLLRKNPFSFQLGDFLEHDSKERKALKREQEAAFLDFIKNDTVYSKYYDFIYILFNTGLRISEMCGLTFDDVDIINRTISVNHQLLYVSKIGLLVSEPKTDKGTRILPMSESVCECFKRVFKNRPRVSVEPVIDGKSGFIFLNKRGRATYNVYWVSRFKSMCKKYNRTHDVELPNITPHICRHTYCTRMAQNGVKPKVLQYLMGHSDITITLRVYTHLESEDILEEVEKLKEII